MNANSLKMITKRLQTKNLKHNLYKLIIIKGTQREHKRFAIPEFS